MTTNSMAYIGRSAIKYLEKHRPDIKIKKISGGSIGSTRIVKIYFEDGRYIQDSVAQKGMHTGMIAANIVKLITDACPLKEVRHD